MEQPKGILIDLDGTLYHGSIRIEGADRLIGRLKKQGIPYLFVTNNSSRTPEQVANHLQQMGIPARPEEVCTSSLAAAHYIAGEAPGAAVAMIGEQGLRHALESAGLILVEDDPQYVVQGIDRSFDYESLTRSMRWIQGGAKSVLTNPDLQLPSDTGLTPGAGSIGAAIEAASGVQPIVIGKPSSILMKFATDRLGQSPEETIVLGDNIRTDIAAGAHAGCRTVLVLTGVTTEHNMQTHIEAAGVSPDYVCRDLMEAADLLCGSSDDEPAGL
ncbi:MULTISPECIES: TIGR01457 family HAD-type hydrolase [Paenibacillus]|uniref:Acid sugar phosphatase n=1 Tax=Paenibacillus campinasensis TaxID=66347 RepID=A0A268F1X9_9BACL|nr:MULTISPECIES: TIGR01457 family HAD-type hydrolase [Paenibacillus]PAD79344.1 TIGR01457 family HAD-type hydrolase [Paenibacillus campinasensis]PAK51713.1 TIGR01457 family HAD-type hydrolase [Paenibacillus sp. 7541]